MAEPAKRDGRADDFDLDAQILRFDAAWQSPEAPQPPDPADFLVDLQGRPLVGEPRRRLLLELVMIDMECRWRAAARRDETSDSLEPDFPKQPRVEDYLGRYGELGSAQSPPAALVINEYRVRCRWGDRPTREEFLGRFGALPDLGPALDVVDRQLGRSTEPTSEGLQCRCPHCRQMVVVPERDDVVRLTCPECGSAFSLIGGDTDTESSGQPLRFGRFEFLQRLGGGSFGMVWKARDTELDRIVAVKVAHRAIHDDQAEALLVREARAAAGLRHAGIVTVHEISRQDDRTYVVSDYIDGQTLEQWAAARRPTFRQAARLCQTLAESLHYAHTHGIVHRDLKPSNILIDAADAPYVTDFGLAKRLAAETTVAHDGRLLGTPAYMSPEQALGQSSECGPPTDVYSLGVILFELLTGERPYRGDVAMILAQVIADEPPSPRKLNAHIPEDVATICLKCMEKEPKSRYPTALELSRDLGRYLRGEPIVARPVRRFIRGWRWAKRNPLAVALIGVTLLSALVLFTGGWWHINRLGDELAINKQLREEGLHRERILRRGEYNRDMRLAKQSLDEEKLDQVHHLLHKYLPAPDVEDQRDFVWHYLWKCSHAWELSLVGHTGHVIGVAWSPDGSRIATTATDGTARVWDARDGRHLATLEGHEGEVNCANFLGGNEALLTGDDSGAVRFWNIAERRELHRIDAHAGHVFHFAISPDGKTLATGGEDGVARVWDVASRKQAGPDLMPHDYWVRGVAWRPDGRLVTADRQGPVRVWDVKTGDCVKTAPVALAEKIGTMGLHPGGRFAVVGEETSGSRLQVVDLEGNDTRKPFFGHESWIKSIQFTRDGKTMYTAAHDGKFCEWDTTSVTNPRRLRRTVAHPLEIRHAAISPDETRYATASRDGTTRIWKLGVDPRWERLGPMEGGLCGIAISSDLNTVAAATAKYLYIWDYPRRELRQKFERNGGTFLGLTISPDQRWLAASCKNAPGRLWSLEDLSQPPLILFDPINHPNGIAFHPREPVLAVTEEHMPLARLLALPNCSFLATLHMPAIPVEDDFGNLFYSSQGKWLAGTSQSRYCSVIVWEAATRRQHMRLEETRQAVAFSHDETRLAVGADDNTIHLFDLVAGRLLRRLVGHEPNIDGLAFSPDDKLLVSVAKSGPMKVWDVERGEEILNLAEEHVRYEYPVFSADGRTLVVGATSADSTREVLLLKAGPAN